MSLKMSLEEREAFLAARHVGVISVEDPGKPPLAAPIWYDFEPGVGVWLITEKTSLKGRLLEKADGFTLVAQNEDMPYKYVSVTGPIVERRPADKEKDSRPMARRYFGVEMGDAYADSGSGGENYVDTMRPERWLTVDYGKLTGAAG